MNAVAETSAPARRKVRASHEPEPAAIASAAERQGSGEPLPLALRTPAERSLDLPLDDVRLHRDPAAGAFANFANARAAQWRNHIFVRPDEYAPDTDAGRNLLGHELAHAGQFAAFGAGSAPVSQAGDASEGEARAIAPRVLSGEPGAAVPQAPPAAAVNRDEPSVDQQVSQLPPEICDENTWQPDDGSTGSPDPTAGEPSETGEDDSAYPGQEYTTDPALIDVRSLTNADLIAQDVEADEMIASFQVSSDESAAWDQLKREIADDRKRRILMGFVFLAEAKGETPAVLITLQPGGAGGSTAIVVADPEVALGTPDVTLTGPIMSLQQMEAYLNSAGLMRVGGEEATRAIEILQSGNIGDLTKEFQAAEPEPDYSDPDLFGDSPDFYGTSGNYRNPIRNDLAMYDPNFLMPLSDTMAMGHMGEVQAMLDPRMMFGMRGTDLNTRKYTNSAGVETSGTFPAFDQSFSDAPFWQRGAKQDRYASVATGDADYLLYKYARMMDVEGRRPPPVVSPDAAIKHVRDMAGDQSLQLGTPEFAAAQQKYLYQTMLAVPSSELAGMRGALMDPGKAPVGTTRRTIMRPHYQQIYQDTLSYNPITITRADGSKVTISTLLDLAQRAPSQRLPSGTTVNPLQTIREGQTWLPKKDRLTQAQYDQVMSELGKMTASRVVSADDANALRNSADLITGVGTPGNLTAPTEVWESRSADPDVLMRRFRNVVAPDPSNPSIDTPLTAVADPSTADASAHLTALRNLGSDPDITRTSPDFAQVNAEFIRSGLLAMPKGTREALIKRVMSAGPTDLVELDIRNAILADNPAFGNDEIRTFLESTTGEYGMTPKELQGSVKYAQYLRAKYGANADKHFNADLLTSYQRPGLSGAVRNAPASFGRAGLGTLIGYGVTGGLDKMTGRPVQPITLDRFATDVGVSVASEGAERAIGAYGVSRIPIANPVTRGLVGRAAPGFVVQPVVSVLSQAYSLHEDAKRYHVSDEEYRNRMLHAGGVGVAGAVAGAGTVYIIGKFTAAGAGGGAVAGGVGAVPGAVIGFIVGAVVAAGVMYAADKALPGGEEEYHAEQAAREEEKRRREAEEALHRPLMEFDSSQIPLPFQPSPDMTPEEQLVIANWFVANAQAQQEQATVPYGDEWGMPYPEGDEWGMSYPDDEYMDPMYWPEDEEMMTSMP